MRRHGHAHPVSTPRASWPPSHAAVEVTRGASAAGNTMKYNGALDCVRKTVAGEGVSALFKASLQNACPFFEKTTAPPSRAGRGSAQNPGYLVPMAHGMGRRRGFAERVGARPPAASLPASARRSQAARSFEHTRGRRWG